MNIDPNAPAFPYEHKFGDGTAKRDTGLTIRAELAARMMAGFAAGPDNGSATIENYAQYAVRWADALIEELNKPTP